jgi:HlyD family secretion protein
MTEWNGLKRFPFGVTIMGMDRQIEKKNWPPKKIVMVAGAGLLVLICLWILVAGFDVSSVNVDRDRLTISTITRGPFQEFIPIVGNVLPLTTVYLDATEGGRVEEIYLEAGSVVKNGDRILKLGNTSLLLDIMWREAELFQQSNNLRNTRLSMEQNRLSLKRESIEVENQLKQQQRLYERYMELDKKGLISKQDFEVVKDQYDYLLARRDMALETQKNELEFRQAQIDALDESLQRMQENLTVAKQKLDNLTVRATESGMLTALNAEIGQSKSPGERLGQIDNLEGFKVRAAIDEYYITRIQVGKTGEFEHSGTTYRLVTKKVYPEVREGRFEVDLVFTGDIPSGITRGQTFHVRLDLGGVSEAVLLPRGGFYQTTGGNWIFVLDKTGQSAFKRPIRIGRQNPQVYEVLEGLEPGEQVVTSSYEPFGDNEKLNIK